MEQLKQILKRELKKEVTALIDYKIDEIFAKSPFENVPPGVEKKSEDTKVVEKKTEDKPEDKKVKKPWLCSICGFKSLRPSEVWRHFSSLHSTEEEKQILKTKLKETGAKRSGKAGSIFQTLFGEKYQSNGGAVEKSDVQVSSEAPKESSEEQKLEENKPEESKSEEIAEEVPSTEESTPEDKIGATSEKVEESQDESKPDQDDNQEEEVSSNKKKKGKDKGKKAEKEEPKKKRKGMPTADLKESLEMQRQAEEEEKRKREEQEERERKALEEQKIEEEMIAMFEASQVNNRMQYGVNGFHHGRMDRAGTKREIIQSAQDVESQQPIKRARNSNSNQGQAESQQLTQQQPFQIVRYPDQLQDENVRHEALQGGSIIQVEMRNADETSSETIKKKIRWFRDATLELEFFRGNKLETKQESHDGIQLIYKLSAEAEQMKKLQCKENLEPSLLEGFQTVILKFEEACQLLNDSIKNKFEDTEPCGLY